ncbi:hypothetical protein GCM10023224_05670 [Streptomonospora halophila]|uniref:Uncharacterized protein n=1 Tax=Streptomonospora halophila TaxID=427369 RepID=A0ABP9G605_9ACTN
MAAPTRPHPLADLLAEAGVALTPTQERVIALLEETGFDQDAASLLRTYAAHLVPAPRAGLRSAHFVDRVAHPSGADPEAAGGLPTYMTIGLDTEGPWWHCSRHCKEHRGLVDAAFEVTSAKDHLDTYHQGWRSGDDR